jgi:hypothetical protein
MNENVKIFFKALFIGLPIGALAVLPWLMTSDALIFLAGLSAPGFLIGLLCSGGNIHSISDSTIIIGNLVSYPVLVYVVLYLRRRARTPKQ